MVTEPRVQRRSPSSTLKSMGLSAVAGLGLPRLYHRMAMKAHVSILMYHAVVSSPLAVDDWCFLEADNFTDHLNYLRDRFEVIRLSDAVGKLETGLIRRPTAVLTFDDGFQNNFDVVFPLLIKAGLPAAVFLTTDLIGSDDTVWFCRLHRALSETRQSTLDWEGGRYELDTPSLRSKASAELQRRLKEYSPPHVFDKLNALLFALGDDPARPVESGSPYRMLDLKSVQEMARSGPIEFGAHTKSHIILSRLPEAARREEIRDSVNAVTALTGRPCRLFAYPNGQASDYNQSVVKAVKECGVHTAVTTISGPNSRETPPLELRRYGIGSGMTMPGFQASVHHLMDKFKNGDNG